MACASTKPGEANRTERRGMLLALVACAVSEGGRHYKRCHHRETHRPDITKPVKWRLNISSGDIRGRERKHREEKRTARRYLIEPARGNYGLRGNQPPRRNVIVALVLHQKERIASYMLHFCHGRYSRYARHHEASHDISRPFSHRDDLAMALRVMKARNVSGRGPSKAVSSREKRWL